jgi:hypothetical protein
VAPGSPFNKRRLLPGLHASSQRAELAAGIVALETAVDITSSSGFFRSTSLR